MGTKLGTDPGVPGAVPSVPVREATRGTVNSLASQRCPPCVPGVPAMRKRDDSPMENSDISLLDRVAQLTDQLFAEGLPEAHVPPASEASPLPDLSADNPYRHCGSRERGRWLGGRAGDRSQLIRGDEPPVAVKVWSDVVQAEVWVVADDLSPDKWPTDATVYRHAEVRLLIGMGQDKLELVHLVKTLFDARLLAG